MANVKTRILSGIQPTGKLHIGNYLGALKNFIELQETHDAYFAIVDLHSLTGTFTAKEKREQIFEMMVDFLALGLNPKKATLFLQSHIPAHTELLWILSCITPYAELKRMTQFKDKSDHDPKNINAGLFTYPVLQAADVLLYRPAAVPIGKDQEQHLELSRVLARAFNKRFSKCFIEPKPLFTEFPVVMSLHDPKKKMSKSHGMDRVIAIDDEPALIHKKIKKAVTTPEGVKNLVTLIKAFGGPADYKPTEGAHQEMKELLANLIANYFADYRANKKTLMRDKGKVITAFADGTKRAKKVAEETLNDVREAIGLV